MTLFSRTKTIANLFLLVFDGKVRRTICNYDRNRTTPTYFYFLSTIYPPFELIICFCFPLLINIICTILIVRSLRLRMRAAKRFNPLNRITTNSNQKSFQARIQKLFSCFIPQTTTKSSIYSCFCCQIQCRRHRELRLKIGRNKRSLIKYEEQNESIERQQPTTLTNCLSQDFQQITTITSTILNRTHRTRRIRDIHLSAMLIVLNVLYLILNLPFNLHQTFGRMLHKKSPDKCVMLFTQLLLDLLQQTYFSTNFFLYVLTNRRFREEFYNTIMKLFTRKEQYILKKTIRRRQARSLSVNPSTAILSNFNGDYQNIVLPNKQNRDSIISDIELIESPLQQQQTTTMSDESNKIISKLVMLTKLSNEHL